jgi:hypothetical protein
MAYLTTLSTAGPGYGLEKGGTWVQLIESE